MGWDFKECLMAVEQLVDYIEKDSSANPYACTGMLTMNGRCKTLDATADGYVRAETCIVLLLQSMTGTDSATSDSADSPADSSMAVFLKGTFVNQACPLKSTLCFWLQTVSANDAIHPASTFVSRQICQKEWVTW